MQVELTQSLLTQNLQDVVCPLVIFSNYILSVLCMFEILFTSETLDTLMSVFGGRYELWRMLPFWVGI